MDIEEYRYIMPHESFEEMKIFCNHKTEDSLVVICPADDELWKITGEL